MKLDRDANETHMELKSMRLKELFGGYEAGLLPSKLPGGITTLSYSKMMTNLNHTHICSIVTITPPTEHIPIENGTNGMMRISGRHVLRRTRIK